MTTSPKVQTRVLAAAGRLSNEHFLMCAEHLEMEVEVGTFSLIRAMGTGHIEIYVHPEREGHEYVIFAESATYSAATRQLQVAGWTRTRENGVERFRDNAEAREVLDLEEIAGMAAALPSWKKAA